MTFEFNSYVDIEVSYMLYKVSTSLWLLVNVWIFYVTYILDGFNYLYMVITRMSSGIGWRFPDIANLYIISCEPLLHQYN